MSYVNNPGSEGMIKGDRKGMDVCGDKGGVTVVQGTVDFFPKKPSYWGRKKNVRAPCSQGEEGHDGRDG